MRDHWTREETLVAFNAYCKIPFKKCRQSHPLIRHYAEITGRSPSAMNMKVGNIGRLDPKLRERGITGLRHGSKTEAEIWAEFYKNPEKVAYESERLIAALERNATTADTMAGHTQWPSGQERPTLVRQRVNQDFFRSAVLSAYNCQCCISGIGHEELLEACHIIGWSEDPHLACNPENGLCLNAFFHKAYDKHLVGITPEGIIRVSEELLEKTDDKAFRLYLKETDGRALRLPDRFLPRPDFLEAHYRKYVSRNS